MDDMQDYEVNDVLECLTFLDRPSWEMARLQTYATVQVNSRKKLEPSDILSFPWDSDYTKKEKDITEKDISRLTGKAEALSKIIKKNG